MPIDTFVVFTGIYPDKESAEADYELVKGLSGREVLVDADDRCGTLAQIRALMEGYSGPYSFEPFAASVHGQDDIGGVLEASMHWIDREIARVPA